LTGVNHQAVIAGVCQRIFKIEGDEGVVLDEK
jgi:hypothetical protein